MKTPRLPPLLPAAVLCALPVFPAIAADASADKSDTDTAPAPALIEGTVSFSGGGTFLDGNRAAFEKRFQTAKDGFGGLERFRLRRDTEDSFLVVESHALAGENDYGLKGLWSREKTGYLDFGFRKYRVFYDGSGGYFAPAAAFFPLYGDRLAVDRERLWLELGFTPDDLPRLRLRYERLTRKGEKPSTTWGDTNLTGGRGARAIVPAFLELDETRDIFSVNVDHSTEAWDWAAGVRYEHSEIDNSRQNFRRPQEPAARAVTTRDQTESDLFTSHAYVERRFGENFRTSAGAQVTSLDTNVDGDRIYGPDYDPVYNPAFSGRQSGDLGFLDLAGGTRLKQHVFNLNAVYQPTARWRIHPGLRYENQQVDGLSTFITTNVGNTLATTLVNASAVSEKQDNRLTGTLEVKYQPRPTWDYRFKSEWGFTEGDLEETLRNSATQATLIDRGTDYTRTHQKYSIAALWYARPGLTFTSEYFYRLRLNDYDAFRDSTAPTGNDRYPAFITNQDFVTHDINLRATWRILPSLTTVTRYDRQSSTVTTSYQGLPEIRNGRLDAHILSESLTWTPHARLYVMAAANLTYDQFATPGAPYVRNADNNFLNSNLSAGYVLNEKTDLVLDASDYHARNFVDTSAFNQPYGAEQETRALTLTAIIRQTAHLIFTLKYRYATHEDFTSGFTNDYRAHSVYAKTEYTF